MRGGVPQHLRSRAGVKRSDAVKSADALVLVYSITDRESFKALSGLRDDVLKYVHRAPRATLSHTRFAQHTLKHDQSIRARDDDGGPPLVLLGQDSHKEFGRKVKREEADSLAKKWKCSSFEVSSLTNHNIEEVGASATLTPPNRLLIAHDDVVSCRVCRVIRAVCRAGVV